MVLTTNKHPLHPACTDPNIAARLRAILFDDQSPLRYDEWMECCTYISTQCSLGKANVRLLGQCVLCVLVRVHAHGPRSSRSTLIIPTSASPRALSKGRP